MISTPRFLSIAVACTTLVGLPVHAEDGERREQQRSQDEAREGRASDRRTEQRERDRDPAQREERAGRIAHEVLRRFPDVNGDEIVGFIHETFPREMRQFRELAERHVEEAVELLTDLVRQSLELREMRRDDPNRYERVMKERGLDGKADLLAEKYAGSRGEDLAPGGIDDAQGGRALGHHDAEVAEGEAYLVVGRRTEVHRQRRVGRRLVAPQVHRIRGVGGAGVRGPKVRGGARIMRSARVHHRARVVAHARVRGRRRRGPHAATGRGKPQECEKSGLSRCRHSVGRHLALRAALQPVSRAAAVLVACLELQESSCRVGRVHVAGGVDEHLVRTGGDQRELHLHE